jgi:hypothetical protein
VDPASTTVIRVTARAWWLLTWVILYVGVTVLGPQRGPRLKILVQAPVQEFARARRLADRIS